jgi:hypothetical protein
MILRYAAASPMPLLACPFCREMFEAAEAKTCPVCGVELTPFEKLPPSHDAMSEDEVPTAPEAEELPWKYLGRGKGALAGLAVAGLVLFFLPWIQMTLPHVVALSGFDLARRLGWSWGAGVAWLVLVPTVMSRRSIVQLRGARVAATFLSGVPAVTIVVLLARPQPSGIIPVQYTFDWPLWTTLAISLVAVFFAVRLGGRVDDIRVSRGSSVGQQVH